MDDSNANLLARLKGPALAIFLAVGRGRGVPPHELQQTTGWGRSVTYGALRRLAAAGWITRDRRGCWWLTAAGHAVAAELLRGLAPWAESAVPQRNTAIHSQGITVPDGNTGAAPPVPQRNAAIHSARAAVLPDNTDGRRAVPPDNTGGRPAVPETNRAQSSGLLEAGTGPHDHDHEDDHLTDEMNTEMITRALRALGFDGAEAWLATVDRRLVMPWVRYLQENPGKHNNPAGYLRMCVEHGDLPRQPRERRRPRRRSRDPCPDCGRTIFADDGDCLVCAGIVKV